MASILSNNTDIYLRAAVLAVGGELTIPDTLLIQARSIEFSRFDNSKGRCVTFTAKIGNSEAVKQPLTQVKTSPEEPATPDGEITPCV